MPYTMDDFRREHVKEHLERLTLEERLEGVPVEEIEDYLNPRPYAHQGQPVQLDRTQDFCRDYVKKHLPKLTLAERLQGVSFREIKGYLSRRRKVSTARPTDFLTTLRYRLAELAVGPSALRNQGAPGVIAAARRFLKGLDLGSFVLPSETRFLSRLNEVTICLQKSLPKGARHWGAARKALNLFLRDALYCSDLASHYDLQAVRSWLEIPLDSHVAKGLALRLRRYPHLGRNLPRWKRIKHLDPEDSDRYQRAASDVAKEERIARVDLDVIFWRAETLQPPVTL